MADILVTSPFQPFTLPTQFKAVFNGYIYCGTVDAVDPSVSQVQVYLVNEAGDKVPVAQPLRTNAGGYLVYNGQPAKFVTDSNHSLLVQDSSQVQVWYTTNMAIIDPSAAFDIIGTQSREALRRSYADAGYILVTGSFEAGGVLGSSADVLLHESSGKAYSGSGPFPQTVLAGTNPESVGFTDRSGSLLRSQVSALESFAATGADVAYTPQDRANRNLFAVDFGNNPNTDVGESLNKSIKYLNVQGDVFTRGGTVRLRRGVNPVSTPILLDQYLAGSDETDAINIIGDGAGTSELRAVDGYSSVAAIVKSNEPTGNPVQLFRLSDFSTRGGYNGIRLETASRGTIERVVVQSPTNDGVYVGNSWVNHYSGVLVNAAGQNGVNFDPERQKTSTVVTSGYVNGAAANGWVWGFMNYSVANGVASDAAGLNGHHIKNSDCFVMNGCGNEGSGRAGIFAEASAAIGANRSISINGHFSHNSNLSNNGWANLLHVKSTNNVDNKISIRNSTSSAPNFGTADIIADGVGAIVVNDNNILPNGVKTYNGGYIDHVHHPLLINSLNIPAATATAVCNLGSTQGHTTNVSAETSAFAGEVTVLAATAAPSTADRRIAIYKLLVCSAVDTGKQVTQMASLGFVSGSVAGAPSFTWTINSANRLVATPIGSSAGNFWFEITTDSQVKASKI